MSKIEELKDAVDVAVAETDRVFLGSFTGTQRKLRVDTERNAVALYLDGLEAEKKSEIEGVLATLPKVVRSREGGGFENLWGTLALSSAASLKMVAEDIAAAHAKWWMYEEKYILPMFKWAAEMGVDLKALVVGNAGKNSTELFVSFLREKIEALKAALRLRIKECSCVGDQYGSPGTCPTCLADLKLTGDPPPPPPPEGKPAMVFLNGSKHSFRCECGANVFTKYGENKYSCNGCRAMYTGE